MSTSGDVSWTLTIGNLVQAALRKLAVISDGSTPTDNQIYAAQEAANALVASLMAEGMPVWQMVTASFTTSPGVTTYPAPSGTPLPVGMPMKVVQAWRQTNGQANIPMNLYTDYNYNLLPQTATSGTPVNFYYQPLRTAGVIKLWPAPDTNQHVISYRYQRQCYDFTETSNTEEVDFPTYWAEALIYLLAARLAPEYGIPLMDRQMLNAEAKELKEKALGFGTEEGSMYLQPDWSGRY